VGRQPVNAVAPLPPHGLGAVHAAGAAAAARGKRAHSAQLLWRAAMLGRGGGLKHVECAHAQFATILLDFGRRQEAARQAHCARHEGRPATPPQQAWAMLESLSHKLEQVRAHRHRHRRQTVYGCGWR
jgi:hypothetical protein